MAPPRYQVAFAPAVDHQLRKLAENIQKRFVRAVDVLQTNPRPPGVVKLAGAAGLNRIRVGEWRVVYQIQDDRLIVLVVRVAYRRDVYRKDR